MRFLYREAMPWVAIAGLVAACDSATEPSAEQPPRLSSMVLERGWHSMTVLRSGDVLVAGGGPPPETARTAEVYHVASGIWTLTGSMAEPRMHPAAVTLRSGKVLIAGGWRIDGQTRVLTTAELYDPETGTFSPTGAMRTPRTGPGILLPSGDVLVVGGWADPRLVLQGNTVLPAAELYHPDTGTFSPTGDMLTARGVFTTMVALASGDVLVAGGATSADVTGGTEKVEIYSAADGTFRETTPLDYQVTAARGVLLPSGEVLLVGGCVGGWGGCTMGNDRARIYDPERRAWRATGPTPLAREIVAAVGVAGGKVVVVGSAVQNQPFAGGLGAVFDATTGAWSTAPLLQLDHGYGAPAVLLANGEVLICGGLLSSGDQGPLIAGIDPHGGLWHPTGHAERFVAPP